MSKVDTTDSNAIYKIKLHTGIKSNCCLKLTTLSIISEQSPQYMHSTFANVVILLQYNERTSADTKICSARN